MSEPTKEQIEKALAFMRRETAACLEPQDVGEQAKIHEADMAFAGRIAIFLAAETAALHEKAKADQEWMEAASAAVRGLEAGSFTGHPVVDCVAGAKAKIASLERQLEQKATGTCGLCLAAIYDVPAPPAQTQRPDLVRLAHLYEHSDPDCEIPGCSCCPALIELLNKVAAPLTLEKQPSPAAAPAQLSALATAQRGLDEWCKAAMQERARADAAEARLAALAGQPARLVLAEAMEQGEKDREAMGRQHDSQKLPGRIR